MTEEMSYGDDYKRIPATSVKSGKGMEVLPYVYSFTTQIVNLYFVGNVVDKDFVLIDAGTPKNADKIIEAVEEHFGKGSRPKAIILTHGHFDHVGSIIELVEHWNVPVYAHERELPYLTGKESYPKPDAMVEGGSLAKMSPMYPTDSIDLGDAVHPLPADGTVPHMPDFTWIHTPGHTKGHVSFFREKDRTLIAGDAFVTVEQESLYKVMTQKEEMNGPPNYLTPDWKAAKESVRKLEKLKPNVAVTGHGKPMTGDKLRENLKNLADNFDEVATPDHGKYVDDDKQ